jgi:hypothetical protein
MSKAAFVMSIVALVFSTATLALVTLSFVMKRITYFDAN